MTSAPSREPLPNRVLPNGPAKQHAVAAPAGPAAAQPGDEAPASNAPPGKQRGDGRQSPAQLARQRQRAPDSSDRATSDQVPYPAPRRVIVLPPPPPPQPQEQATSEDRGRWGGGLFDFFGQNHWQDDGGWHDSHDWHD
jgi:hypothetical protein